MKKSKNRTEENEQLKDENGNTISINSDQDFKEETLVDKKTLKKYKVHWYQRIPYPVRACLIKYWFFGLNYFLFEMGLGYLTNFNGENGDLAYGTVLLILIAGFALGAFNDLFVYNILDVIEDYPNQKERFVFFKSKKVYSLFINIAYGIVMNFIGRILAGQIALAIANAGGAEFWFREPFTVAVILFIVDGAFISIKNLIVALYKHITHKDEDFDRFVN